MNSGNQVRWFKIAGLCLLLFLAVYWLVAQEATYRGGLRPFRHTTYSSGAGGYKALYLWLRELRIPLRRWEKPLISLNNSDSVFVVVQPEIDPGPNELKALEKWVFKGGTLILIMEPPDPFLTYFGLKTGPVNTDKTSRDEGKNAMYQPGPYTRGVRTLIRQGFRGLSSTQPQAVFHYRDKWGGLLAVKQKGQGRMIALADPGLFSNAALRKGDHFRLALNLFLAHYSQGDILVDEFHHGYGRATSVLGHLSRSPALKPLVQAMLVLGVLLCAWGRRFGPPRPLTKPEPRSSLEYVRALANLFWRSKARHLALETLIGWFEDEARRGLIDTDNELKEKIDEAKERLKKPRINDRELLMCVRGLYAALDDARGRHRYY